MKSAWLYNAAEKRAIDRAYNAVAYIADHTGDGYTLRDALRHERRERSSATVAKALLIAGFFEGRKRNPRATELAYISAGIVRATLLGAKSRRLEKRGTIGDTLREFPKLAAAAAVAHEGRQRRGIETALQS